MPVKRRANKRRIDPAVELEAWGPFFESGLPGFAGDLEELGHHDQEAMRAAAPDAWSRLGRLFLDRRERADQPWALREFGAPEAVSCR